MRLLASASRICGCDYQKSLSVYADAYSGFKKYECGLTTFASVFSPLTLITVFLVYKKLCQEKIGSFGRKQ